MSRVICSHILCEGSAKDFASVKELVQHIRQSHAELITKGGGVKLPIPNRMDGILDLNYSPFEDDVIIMGRGGTGKSFLLRNLFLGHAKYPIWVWDFRWTYSDLSQLGFRVTHSLLELPYGRAVYQPERSDVETFDLFCQKADSWTNLVVAVEEAHLFTGKYSFKSAGFENLVKAGRPKGISLITITRRPQQLHNDILSDADHIFCFTLELPNDVLYVKKWIGAQVELLLAPEYRTVPQLKGLPQLTEHSFVYKAVKEGRTDMGRL